MIGAVEDPQLLRSVRHRQALVERTDLFGRHPAVETATDDEHRDLGGEATERIARADRGEVVPGEHPHPVQDERAEGPRELEAGRTPARPGEESLGGRERIGERGVDDQATQILDPRRGEAHGSRAQAHPEQDQGSSPSDSPSRTGVTDGREDVLRLVDPEGRRRATTPAVVPVLEQDHLAPRVPEHVRDRLDLLRAAEQPVGQDHGRAAGGPGARLDDERPETGPVRGSQLDFASGQRPDRLGPGVGTGPAPQQPIAGRRDPWAVVSPFAGAGSDPGAHQVGESGRHDQHRVDRHGEKAADQRAPHPAGSPSAPAGSDESPGQQDEGGGQPKNCRHGRKDDHGLRVARGTGPFQHGRNLHAPLLRMNLMS